MIPNDFTSNEAEIMRLLLEGWKNRRIAEHLHLSEHTVRGQFQKIYDKTGCSNRLELALYLFNVNHNTATASLAPKERGAQFP